MKKVLSFVLVLSMVLSSVSMAFAATDNKVAQVPSVATKNSFATEITLASTDDNGIPAAKVQKIKLTLENAEFATGASIEKEVKVGVGSAAAIGIDAVTDGGSTAAVDSAMVVSGDDSYAEIAFTLDKAMKKGEHITLSLQLTAAKTPGEVKVAIDSLDSRISSGTYTVAIAGSKATVATVPGTPAETGRTLTGVKGASIEVRETAVNAVNTTAQSIKLTLAKGFEWNSDMNATGVTADAYVTGDMVMAGSVTMTVQNDNRDLFIDFEANTDNDLREVLVIKPLINVTKEAKLGDIEVQLRKVTKATQIGAESGLVVAKYVEEGVTVSTVDEEDLPEIVAGRLFEDGSVGDNYVVEVTLTELQDKSLIGGKYVDFTFPEYVQITSGQAITYTFDGTEDLTAGLDYDGVGAADATSKNNNSFEWEVKNAAGTDDLVDTECNEVTFYIPVTVEAGTKAGDIELTVSGPKAGVEETKLVVAKVVEPVTAEFKLSDVKTGVQNQAIGEIIIKENFAGALQDAANNETVAVTIERNSMRGFAFSAAEIEVVKGDLEIKENSFDIIGEFGSTMVFDVERTSIKTPSEIKISGIEVTLDRTPAEGKYEVGIGGDALVTNDHQSDFSSYSVAGDFINVVTPADQGVNATFKIGESKYTVNGVEVAMDAPSYVDDNNRTMVSIRYVANALGVSDNKIIWNEATQTATIFGKSTVVVTIGEDHITVNGSVVPMDTQAVNKAGRIYVPLRYIANALGAAVEWNQEAQTATIITVANN